MSYYEPDDDGSVFEAAYDAGFWSPDDIDELRALLKHYEYPDPFPRPGNRNDAILVLLDHKLNPKHAVYSVPNGVVEPPEDPHVTWAKILLKDVL